MAKKAGRGAASPKPRFLCTGGRLSHGKLVARLSVGRLAVSPQPPVQSGLSCLCYKGVLLMLFQLLPAQTGACRLLAPDPAQA